VNLLASHRWEFTAFQAAKNCEGLVIK